MLVLKELVMQLPEIVDIPAKSCDRCQVQNPHAELKWGNGSVA